MDTAFSITVANTFMKRGIFETRVPRRHLVYKLFIDDIHVLTIFVIWDCPCEIPLEFLHAVDTKNGCI